MLACLHGLLTLFWLHGWSLLLNLLLCASAALLCEALLLTLRAQPLRMALNDGSALVTAVLLTAALPTPAPWWLPVVAASVAIGIGKQAFGGVGRNLFNPAMVGYAFALLSFPLQMNHWRGRRQACSTACSRCSPAARRSMHGPGRHCSTACATTAA